MRVLSSEYLFTQELIEYVYENHGRHWSKSYVYLLIMHGKIPVFKRIGRQNIYKVEDVDAYIATLTRNSSSGVKGVPYKNKY